MKMLTVEQKDGSVWGVPVEVIALHRATHFAGDYDGDVQLSLDEDTSPLFEDDYEVEDWAANQMNWSDVQDHAMMLQEAPLPDFQEAWVNGTKLVVDA